MNFGAAEAVAIVMLAALTIYVVLGGADYGGGVWDLFARGPRADDQRELIAHAIGPVWEANHVWLIIVLVLLFTGFPAAFTAIMTVLHVPLALMLVGIVLRGSAFTFRSYDTSPRGAKRWNRVFSIPSVLTPVLLGMIVGAIATGKVGEAAAAPGPIRLFSTWLKPFPIVVGLWTLAIFAYLAAVYLTLETADESLRGDFRRRALVAALAVGVLAYAVYGLAHIDAPLVFEGLGASRWGPPVHIATGTAAVTVLIALWRRWYRVARALAVAQVALILLGCALAINPYLVPPAITIANSSAPAIIQQSLLGALAVGSLVLVPSLYYLFRIFKGHTFGLEPADGGNTRTT
jgi:cytochrome d ubiquinol oxidase subunit II